MKNKFGKCAFRAFCMAMPIFMILQMGGCRKAPVIDNELITTIKFHMEKNGLPDSVYVWQDLDADGGNAPNRIDTILLRDSAKYEVRLQIIDETKPTPAVITGIIQDEGENHLFCFTPGPGLFIKLTDSDGKFPIGILSEWTCSGKNSGSLRLVLRHQPGVKNGSCDPGETDIDITIPYIIK